jgi:triacylglycerol lipase
MMAFWLRCRLAAEAVILIAAGVLFVRSGVASPLMAAAGAVGIFLMLHSGAIVVSFAVSRLHAAATPPDLAHSRPSILLIAIGEWLAYQALFIFIQPLERLWMGDDAVGRQPPDGVPLLLVHGYLCNRGAWWWLRRKLKAAGFAVATINHEPPLESIDGFADQLHTRIEALCTETGADQIAVVGHSLGGLAARVYLHQHESSRVAKLVTLGSPHHGTWLAYYGLGENARQMEPDSAWIRALPPADPRVPTVTIWSPTDNFVAPQDSSRLAGASEKILPGLSHLAMFFSPVVLDALMRELPSANSNRGSQK